MVKHSYPGLFIAFEGLDGAGSSGQVVLLVKALKEQGIDAVSTKEPTNDVIGKIIRDVLTHKQDLPAESLQFLYAADRKHHLERLIIPGLKKNKVVITDRYLFSSIAFGSNHHDKSWLIKLYDNFILPDITFFLNVKPKVCLDRINKFRGKFDFFEKSDYLKNAYKTYLGLLKNKKLNIVDIDGEKTIEEVHKEIIGIINSTLEKRK